METISHDIIMPYSCRGQLPVLDNLLKSGLMFLPHVPIVTGPPFKKIWIKRCFHNMYRQWRRKGLIKEHARGFGFLLQNGGEGGSPEIFLNIWYIDSKKIYLKLLLISFNHVNNVIDAYTCHKPKAFVCVLIKLVYDCIQWNLKVSVNMTVAMPKVIVFPVPLWRVDISLHVSKRWNIFRLLLVEGGIVSKITSSNASQRRLGFTWSVG